VDSLVAGAAIEKAMYDMNGDPDGNAYKSKFRTLMFNLKDKKNGSLRQKQEIVSGRVLRVFNRILRKEISAEKLVRLSTEELANEEKKRENDDIRKTKLRECERGMRQSATTDAFTCGKCKANKSSVISILS